MNSPSLSLVQNPVRSRQFVEATPAPTLQGDFPGVSPLSGRNGMSPTPPDINGIVLRIRSLLPTLTVLEASVVTGLFKKRFIDERTLLKWVADEMRVSEAMVVKIAKKLGFSGFRAFRSALAEYNNFPTTQLHAELFANDSAGNIVQKVVQASIKALEQNLAVIEQAAIEKAAKYLSSSVFRDFYGVGGSGQVARDAAFKFLRIGVRASVFDDSQMMLMSACLLEKTDVAVAFSHCGQTAVVIDAVRQARRRREDHCGDQLPDVNSRPGIRCCTLLQCRGIAHHRRKCCGANRSAKYCGCFVFRRRPEELRNRRKESSPDDVSGQRTAKRLVVGEGRVEEGEEELRTSVWPSNQR